jgi:Chemotaxis signal transduction protein
MEKSPFQEKTAWLVLFELLGETWGIRFADIQELLETKEITPVPKAPSFISGITHKRGKIITVLDLGLLVGEVQKANKEIKIIYLKSAVLDIGLLITSKVSSELLPDALEITGLVVKKFGENEKMTIEKSIIRAGKKIINVLEVGQLIKSLEEYYL